MRIKQRYEDHLRNASNNGVEPKPFKDFVASRSDSPDDLLAEWTPEDQAGFERREKIRFEASKMDKVFWAEMVALKAAQKATDKFNQAWNEALDEENRRKRNAAGKYQRYCSDSRRRWISPHDFCVKFGINPSYEAAMEHQVLCGFNRHVFGCISETKIFQTKDKTTEEAVRLLAEQGVKMSASSFRRIVGIIGVLPDLERTQFGGSRAYWSDEDIMKVKVAWVSKGRTGVVFDAKFKEIN